ncbi:efflux RND transporter periplasmic adaptor subunit [Streptomyces jumonjinensis]|uniref:HlyD family efflux transporter periplasmic adaptor subunit n=1 Tax=Streptomyces jumonjinensis TaxID=1945 RepID=A0A646KTZ0_STRJU|nr:peptidoglycan-binding protein [Streptomyces jumonjinensis]MQT05507.1 HlyD family efflux transporter periplasmic adaptor subunit [Streptomyces jumonjinensis]
MSTTEIPTEKAESAPPPEEQEPSPRPRRRGRAAAVIVALVAAGGVGVVAITQPFDNRASDTTVSDGESGTGTAKVAEGTLSSRTQQNGTLGYAGSYSVVNKVDGTVTKLPTVGQVIHQGKPLYWVDGKPVILLKGKATPAYRELSRGMEGADVKQLNAALVELEYATDEQIDPDSDYFSRNTRWALKKLQDDVGLEETGKLSLGQALFLPVEEIRVTTVDGVRGGSAVPGKPILQGSSTSRQVTVELNASQQSDVKTGDKVTITLPDDSTTPGVVSSVGKVAKQGENKTTIDVKIKPTKPKATGRLDKAPVQVAIVSRTVKNVLSVPVDGLLALAGGGYAVEVVKADGTRELVTVETGLFDDSAGRVEVTGSGLKAGQSIVVPGQ